MTPPHFPSNSRPWPDIQAEIVSAHAQDKPWYAPRQFKGGSYFGGADVTVVEKRSSLLEFVDKELTDSLVYHIRDMGNVPLR